VDGRRGTADLAGTERVSTSSPSSQKNALAIYAVLTVLSFPHELPGGVSFDLGLVFVWLGPAALIVGIDGLTPGRAARAAFIASLAGHFVLFHWFFVVTVKYGGMPVWLGVLTPLAPALYVSIFTVLFAWVWTRYGATSRFPIVIGAMLWVVIDWTRGHFLGGFPWATLGYGLHLDGPLVAWTRWTGVYALSFFAIVIAVALGRAWLSRGAATIRSLALSVGCVAIAHGVGFWISQVDFDSAVTVRIAAVQGDIDQGQKWDADLRDRILETYLSLSTVAADEGAQWIVWPETAVPGLIEADPLIRSRIRRLASSRDVWLIVGATGVDFDPISRSVSSFFDSAFVFDPDGNMRDRYDKSHLVPFGEYVPLRDLLGRFFQSLARGLSTTDITAGPKPRTIRIEGAGVAADPLQIVVPICYELLFPHVVRRFGADGAGVMLAITNDAWYGRTGAPHQFLAMTTVRAAENGRWMVRAANTGISAIIDSHGRVREASALFEEAVLIADVPVSTQASATFYARFGDVFVGLCVLGLALVLGLEKFEQRNHSTRERIEEHE
jgi:apolipoprotein N-acyltransferase